MNYSMNIDTEKLSRHYGRIRLIAIDVDGTLLNTSREISSRTLEVLDRVRSKGVKLVLVTGRNYPGVKPLYQAIRANGPVVCYNGASVINGDDGSVISSTMLDDRITRRIIEFARARDIHIQVFIGNQFYYERARKEAASYEANVNIAGKVISFSEIDDLRALKVLCIADHEKLLEISDEIREAFGDKIFQTFSFPYYLEVMSGEVSKAEGLKVVSLQLGIDPDEIAAFGDGENDIAMLKFAGVGVAMENASDPVKEAAGYVTCSNDEDGLARFLEEYLGL